VRRVARPVPNPSRPQGWSYWLGRLYTEGDEKLRTCIVAATLEHLFEQKDIREFFPIGKSILY